MIKLIVSGRVGQDAELKSVGDTTVCSFSVAHTEKVYGTNPSEKTVWVRFWPVHTVYRNYYLLLLFHKTTRENCDQLFSNSYQLFVAF